MPWLPDLVGLVCLQPVQGVAVLVREDGDGACAQLVARSERANGDLAAVGYQHLAEHLDPFSLPVTEHPWCRRDCVHAM